MSEPPTVLIVFAHPAREKSRVHSTLISSVMDIAGVTIVDLYDEYPDFFIDVAREQERLSKHRLLIFQHPIYWYSCPPLLKEWMDVVLERGWAYGNGVETLKGLDFIQVLSAGGPDSAYLRTGYDRFSIHEMLRPFEATAGICGWNYHEPFMVKGIKSMDTRQMEVYGELYRQLILRYLADGRKSLVPLDTSPHSIIKGSSR